MKTFKMNNQFLYYCDWTEINLAKLRNSMDLSDF